ncbi:MAG: Gfo/Idh/MocA family oxidoreductase [Verrucomicrobia bacterium]|nr:Gfo/Idh/MocA family oxidoreductase [Verrucomicrobiota bacterium]
MKQLSRRRFLEASALGAAMVTSFPSVGRAAEPDRKLKLGLIGCGWYGMVNVEAAFKVGGVEVVALCDVDTEHLEQSARKVESLQGSRPKTFKLHADLLAVDGLDAVIIASPPQWHALQLIDSLNRGLDVYCEKPLAYDIRECRAMADAVKRSGRIVQIGFQRRQSPAFQAVREHVKAGHAGRIVCAEATINYTAGTKDPTPQAPPASLDWDLWCGPAPKIPYSPQVGHFNWRLEKTTGHGHLVDWGIHLIDAARMILGETAPQTVSASGGLYHLQGRITTPDVLTAHFEFASCPLTWRHRLWGAEEYTPEVSNGIFLYGEKQTLFVTDDRWVVIPKGKNAERQVNRQGADTGKLHVAEFLNAVRTRQAPGCPVEQGVLSTTAVKLAMIAYETGAKITWDAGREEIVGNPAASALLKREYRQPWQHPYRA